jgi:RimJ/RimL family protein N-acetyltransferase
MSERGKSLVDGWGARRVFAQMAGYRLFLRPVNRNDCELIWKWANDPVARAMSFNSDMIPWDTHVKWFTSKLSQSDILFLVAEDRDSRPIGQIRYEIKRREAVVSLSIGEQFRGKGYGSETLILSANQLFAQTNVNRIRAYIKPINDLSHRIFRRAGYKSQGTTQIHGCTAAEYILER